ncbi:MAG: YgiQ family radical SAM protein, partial [Clostridiales Family XIII bacterium]|nr:YgiQ family radical SAM protein [Clostridiales Family XIII bacterium]
MRKLLFDGLVEAVRPAPAGGADPAFLPVTRRDMEDRGWTCADFVLVTGDAYADHPSFGAAVIARILEAGGYKVAVLAQPAWTGPVDFRRFGKPRLGFLITSGCVDSMVNRYTAMKRRRRRDVYSPDGAAGLRPDRALIAYTGRAKQAYGDVPVILGGLEAGLRRLGHYDYWDDRVRRSVLIDAKADLLIYGMGERAVLAVAAALNAGFDARDITWVPGLVFRARACPDDAIILPDFERLHDKAVYAESFGLQYAHAQNAGARPLAERYGEALCAVQNPPQPPLTQAEMDFVHELPYAGDAHPAYAASGGLPAMEEVRFSLTSARGCFGGCAFCALSMQQGSCVTGRSKASLLREATKLTQRADFKGYIHDVGGPTANFRRRACRLQEARGESCGRRACLFPEPCPQLEVDHAEYLAILRALRALPGVKKVFIRSGLRYDYLMADPNRGEFLKELCEFHVSGMLKVAPEHVSPRVLARMRKPAASVYERFAAEYAAVNR